jgi:hypothetical protein
MVAVQDALDAVLLGCFLFGLVFAVISLFLGDIGDLTDLVGVHGGHDAGLPINLSAVLVFVAWFGGIGYLLRRGAGWPAPLAVVVGVAGGLVGAAVVTWFVFKVLSPITGLVEGEDYRMPGTIARVTSGIREGGTGEIVYVQGGVRQVSAARAVDGRPISRGTEVVVLNSAAGIAMVQPSDQFFGEDELADEPEVARGEEQVHPAGDG